MEPIDREEEWPALSWSFDVEMREERSSHEALDVLPRHPDTGSSPVGATDPVRHAVVGDRHGLG